MKALEQYGLEGLALGVLLFLILKRSKSAEDRITQLETAQQQNYEKNITAHKEMINQYIELVNNNTKVVNDLTSCLKAIKETLDRLERKQDNKV